MRRTCDKWNSSTAAACLSKVPISNPEELAAFAKSRYFNGVVRRWARRNGFEMGEAEDLKQDCLLVFAAKLESDGTIHSPRSLLKSVLWRKVYTRNRTRRRCHTNVDFLETCTLARDLSPDIAAAHREMRHVITRSLGPDELMLFEGLSVKRTLSEMAEAIGSAVTDVWRRRNRLRDKLRSILIP